MKNEFEANRFKFFKKGIKDRHDGWRVTNVDPLFLVAPFFMRTREGAQVFYTLQIPVDHLETFVKQHKETIPDLSLMHVVMAAVVRLYSQRPYLNRFVAWGKIFARNHMTISLAVKQSMTHRADEVLIKPYFQFTDTLAQVVEKVHVKVQEQKAQAAATGSSSAIGIFGKLPLFLFRFTVVTCIWLDKLGILPRALTHVSPFHTSLFVTNTGSLGIDSVFHHLYEFGSCSCFLAMGKKHRNVEVSLRPALGQEALNEELKTVAGLSPEPTEKKSIMLRLVLDERICDGFYFSRSMREFYQIIMHPEQLLTPPQKIVVDDGVPHKRLE